MSRCCVSSAVLVEITGTCSWYVTKQLVLIFLLSDFFITTSHYSGLRLLFGTTLTLLQYTSSGSRQLLGGIHIQTAMSGTSCYLWLKLSRSNHAGPHEAFLLMRLDTFDAPSRAIRSLVLSPPPQLSSCIVACSTNNTLCNHQLSLYFHLYSIILYVLTFSSLPKSGGALIHPQHIAIIKYKEFTITKKTHSQVCVYGSQPHSQAFLSAGRAWEWGQLPYTLRLNFSLNPTIWYSNTPSSISMLTCIDILCWWVHN